MLGVETSEFAIPLGQSRNWGPAAALAAAEAGDAAVYAQCVNSRPEGTIARTFITRIDRPMLFRAALAGATTTGRNGIDLIRVNLRLANRVRL